MQLTDLPLEFPSACPSVWTEPSASIQSLPSLPSDGIVGRAPTTVRVLHVINGEHFSGAERVQQLLGKRLPEYGVHAEFACIKPGKFASMCDLNPDWVHSFPMKSRWDLATIDRITQLVKERDFDLLHAHTPRSALVTGWVARKTGIPWVYHVHSPASRDSTRVWINRINDLVERWSLANCSKIVTVSRSLRREMLRRGWSKDQLVAIGNGVAEQSCIDVDRRKTLNSWKLGMVALFRPRKGIEVLLEALASLPKETNVELEVIGGFETPQYEEEVRKRIVHLGLEGSVQLTGFTKDVTERMRGLDGMVLPSLFGEGMPMVVLEAMAVGLPILATRVEGTPEVVRDGIEGVLADPGSAESMQKAILRFVASRASWATMSRNAWHRHRSKFTDGWMANRLSKVYRTLVV